MLLSVTRTGPHMHWGTSVVTNAAIFIIPYVRLKQDQKVKVVYNERNPNTSQPQEPAARRTQSALFM
jgi:hypothetical protein